MPDISGNYLNHTKSFTWGGGKRSGSRDWEGVRGRQCQEEEGAETWALGVTLV